MLRTVKKTLSQIHQQKQHYLIALKGNQPALESTLQRLHDTTEASSEAHRVDETHQRHVHRKAWVYRAPTHLAQQWKGLHSLIWVEHWGTRKGQPFHEQVGYISDLDLSAGEFLHHIQQHWGIENRLHWVRDVTFKEDVSRPGGNAPVV